MPTRMSNPTPISLGNSNRFIYLFGGNSSRETYLNCVLRYDIKENTWREIPLSGERNLLPSIEHMGLIVVGNDDSSSDGAAVEEEGEAQGAEEEAKIVLFGGICNIVEEQSAIYDIKFRLTNNMDSDHISKFEI